MGPVNLQVGFYPALDYWEQNCSRYKRDLAIKFLAIAAISLVGAGLITCCFAYTNALLPVKIILCLGISSLAVLGAYKVHQHLQPYFYRKYDDIDEAFEICKEIRLTLGIGKYEFGRDISRDNIHIIKENVTKHIKDWISYGYLMPQSGNKLLKIFLKKIAMLDIMFEQDFPDLIESNRLITHFNNLSRQWADLVELEIFPGLPFELNW